MKAISNEKEKEEYYPEEFTFIIKENVERLWMFMRDCSLSDLLLKEDDVLLEVFDVPQMCFMPGIVFGGKFLKTFEYKGYCSKVITYPNFKKIKWIFTIFSNNIVKVAESFFPIPSKSNTLVHLKVKFNNENIRLIFRQLGGESRLKKLFLSVEEMVHKISKNLSQFESCIIRAPMPNIWDIMTKINRVKLIAPKTNLYSEDETKEEEVLGGIKTVSIENGLQIKYKIKNIKIDKRPNIKSWVYEFSTLDSEKDKKVPTQQVSIRITRVSDQECQVSFIHDFKTYIPFKYLKSLSSEKAYILDSVKDYLENFSCF